MISILSIHTPLRGTSSLHELVRTDRWGKRYVMQPNVTLMCLVLIDVVCLWILLIQNWAFLIHCTLKGADRAKQIKGKMRVLTVFQTCRVLQRDRYWKGIHRWLSKWLQRRAPRHMARTRGTSWWNLTLKTFINNNTSHIFLLITNLNFKFLHIIQIVSRLQSPCSLSWWVLQLMVPNILAEMCN